jgi:uncharacterized membrane protein
MNQIKAYLAELRSKLEGVEKKEREEILAEIETHLEEGLAHGRFQSDPTKLQQEMGSVTELASRLLAAKNRYGGKSFLLFLLSYLFVEGSAYWLSLFEFQSGSLPGDHRTWWLLWNVAVVLIVGGQFLWSWRKRSVVIALWWTSFAVSLTAAPLLTSWMYGWPANISVAGIVFGSGALLLWLWLVWQARFDSLLLLFSILPLLLGFLAQNFWSDQINMVINFRLPVSAAVAEPLVRMMMWTGVMASYFFLKKRWLRWAGIGSVILAYLLSTAVFFATYDQRWFLLSPQLITVWCVLISAFLLIGMGLDKNLSLRKLIL